MGSPRVQTRGNVTVAFVREFAATVPANARTIGTPTDYFRYDVTMTDEGHPLTQPAYRLSADYAFLMENQWIAPLPEVSEGSTGAAPDELVVYYCDMVPFRANPHEPATWVPRDKVTEYVGRELVPQMVEAFRVQTRRVGFPLVRRVDRLPG